MTDDLRIERLSALLKVLAAPIRLKIVLLLHQQGRLTHRRLSEQLEKDSSLTLQHLNQLVAAGLVNRQKQAGRVSYLLAIPEDISQLNELLYSAFRKSRVGMSNRSE